MYAAENYEHWRNDLQMTLPAGGFGENLTVIGLSEATVCVGDCYQIGSATVEVSQTRIPCWKINRRWKRDDLLQLVRDTGRSGWYLRVVRPGFVEAGDEIRLLARPVPDWTIKRVNDAIHGRLRNAAILQQLAELPYLAASQRDIICAQIKKS